nr:unnamed protein product [Spirometra erinaceieuropaei]
MAESGVPQGSVLEPILFLIYVEDAARALDCELAIFADDMKIWSVIRGPADEDRLQMDLNRLEEWSNRWLLRFNVAKCSILRLGNTARSASTRDIFLSGAALKVAEALKDLGVLTTSSLKPSAHSSRVAKIAMSVLEADFTPSNSENMRDPTIENIVFREEAILEELKSLKECKSPGPDEIPAKLLFELAQQLAKPLSFLYQKSFDAGILPTDWKTAHITPLYKSGSRAQATNYRPVHLSSAPEMPRLRHLDVAQIRKASTVEALSRGIWFCFKTRAHEDDSNQWSSLKASVYSAAEKVFRYAQRHRSDWIVGKTLQLSAQMTRARSRNDDSFRQLWKMTANSTRDDRNQYWAEMATSVEQALNVGGFRKLYQLIHQVSGDSMLHMTPGRGPIKPDFLMDVNARTDQVFTLRCILEFCHGYQQPTAVCFVYFVAASDSIRRESLWRIMALDGVPPKIGAMIEAYYRSTTARVLVHKNLSQAFGIRSGVRQGCILSPILFNCAIE